MKASKLKKDRPLTGNKKLNTSLFLTTTEQAAVDTLGDTAVYGIKEGIDALESDQSSSNINDAPTDALNTKPAKSAA